MRFAREVKEAVTALVEFVQKKNAAEQRLFDANTESVQLQFNLRDIPAKPKHKPTLIELPTPLSAPRLCNSHTSPGAGSVPVPNS